MQSKDTYVQSKFYFQSDDGEMKPINAAVTEIKVEPSYDLMGVDWGRPEGSITGTFNSNIRNLSPTLARSFKKVNALGYIYIDDFKNLF